jgi:hypothetical protein
MDRAAQALAEARILGTLCSQTGTAEQRYELAGILARYAFLEPEHQIVFESIHSLLARDLTSTAHLAVHLNNRGFPDVDLEKYCASGLPSIGETLLLARQLVSSTGGAGSDLRYGSGGKAEYEI